MQGDHVIAIVIGNDDVLVAVAVEIANGELARRCRNGMADRLCCEAPRAIVAQDEDEACVPVVVVATAGQHDIEVGVAIEVQELRPSHLQVDHDRRPRCEHEAWLLWGGENEPSERSGEHGGKTSAALIVLTARGSASRPAPGC